MTTRTVTAPSGIFATTLALAMAACSAASDPGGGNDRDEAGSGSGSSTGAGAGTGDGDITIGDGDGDGDIGIVPGDGDGGTNTPGGITLGTHSGACGRLPVTFRDFKGNGEAGAHPDFELSNLYAAGGANWPSANYGEPTPGASPYKGLNEAGCGLVGAALDANLKPIWASGLGQKRTLSPARNPLNNPPVTQQVTACVPWDWGWVPPNVIGSATTFGTWYNDDPAVNQTILGELPLVEDPNTGISEFSSNAFFPLDNAGFGNTPGQSHNYHFTTESHVTFEYVSGSGQLFSFVGDDDLWVFVNGKLAMDLGGVHEPMTGTINFDLQATELGLTENKAYSMDIFHAERQTLESNFRVTVTNIGCFVPVVR